jgi:hypothetical protein
MEDNRFSSGEAVRPDGQLPPHLADGGPAQPEPKVTDTHTTDGVDGRCGGISDGYENVPEAELSQGNTGPSFGDAKPGLKIVHDADTTARKLDEDTEDEDEDERDLRAQRRDLPGVSGSSDVGIVAITVSKSPAGKNEFFRTHPKFNLVVDLVDTEFGMEKQYFIATDEMKTALAGIGVSMSPHTLYLTVSEAGAVRIVPIRCPDEEGSQNEYNRTKEIGLIRGRKEWVRIYTDLKNKDYKVFPAPPNRFPEPVWPTLKPAKLFRLGFRDKGNRIDSHQHQLFLKWAGRRADDQK